MSYAHHIPDPMAAHVARHPVFGPVILNITSAPPAALSAPACLAPSTVLPAPKDPPPDARTEAIRGIHQAPSATHPFLDPYSTHTPSDTPRPSPAWQALAHPYPYPIHVIPAPCWRLMMRRQGAQAVGYAIPAQRSSTSSLSPADTPPPATAWQEHPSPLFQRLQYGYLHRVVTQRLRWPTHLPDGTEYWRIERFIPDQLQTPYSTVTLTAKQPRHHPQPRLPQVPPDLIYPSTQPQA